MKIIALTGGVASGKNYISEIFADFGAKIFDADAVNHEILQNDKEVIQEIAKNFPEAVENLSVNRKKLGEIVFANAEKLKILENIVHPKIKQKYQEFLLKSKEQGAKTIILNVPLLLEKGGYEHDKLIAIATDLKLRKERFIKREIAKAKNQDENFHKKLSEKFDKIVKNQISDEIRQKNADFIVDGSLSRDELAVALKEIAA